MFELARWLPEAEVMVFAPAMPGDRRFDAASGCRVKRIGTSRTGQPAWLLRLGVSVLGTCLRRRPDLIVCGHVITAPAAVLARRLLGIPYLVIAHGYEIRRQRKRRLITRLLRSAAGVVANSQFTQAAVIALGVSPARVWVLHPGVDPEKYAPDPSGAGAGLETVRGSKTILSVSRLNELYKGHDIVIRALPLIKAKCPDVRYVIAGDGRLRDYLSQVACSIGVEQDVVFLGEVSEEALRDLYRSCDVVVQLSRESASGGGAEGFGIVCLEAAACGKPVVAGKSGGLVEAVRDGVTGILVDPLDVGAAAEAIVSVLQDASLARRLGRAGRETVLSGFTWSRMAQEARRIFADAAAKHG